MTGPTDRDAEARLDTTLDSEIEDEATLAVTAKHRAHSPVRPSDAPPPPSGFDSLKQTAARPPLRPSSPAPVPPDPSGLAGAPISIGRPPSSAKPASVPPRPRMPSAPPLPSPISAMPSSHAPLGAPPRPRVASTPWVDMSQPPSEPPLPSSPPTDGFSDVAHASSSAPDSDPVPDDAPTVPGTLGGSLEDGDFDAGSEGPPGIPLLVASPDLDNLDDRRRKGGSRRRNTNRKGKRPTVRIPDDAVHGDDASQSEAERHDAASDDFETSALEADGPSRESFSSQETPTVPATTALLDFGGHGAIPAPKPSAPIITDSSAIAMVRPIEIVSDMPPVPSASARGLAAPPDDDGIEEIEPERMSLPGDIVSAARRMEAPKPPPLPPPRTGTTAPAPPSNPGVPKAPAVAEPRLAIPGPLPVPVAPPSAPGPARSEPPARSLPKPPATTEFTPGRPREKRPWFSELFEDDMVRTLDNPKLRDVERESAFIEQSFRLPKGARLLDVACGHGVHAVELAAHGYEVVALDLSTTLLGLARAYADRRGQSVSFVQGDMRQLELDGALDGVYCWSASFGYFDDATNANVLARMAKALRPGGKLLLDLANRDYVAPRAPSTAWFEKPGCVCMDEVRFDYLTSRLHAKRMVIFENGRAKEVEYSMRLYSASDLVHLLESSGLRVIELSGHRAHRGAYFGNESPRLIALAEKA